MAVTYVIGFQVRDGQRARFLELLNGVLDAMRGEATFLNATLHVDPADPDHYLLHETWTDHDDVVGVQLGRTYRAAWHAALPDLLVGERAVSIWTPLRTDQR
ncbi:putative quinol monooxygenase [Zavarzinia sp. CC-PAN008]|uniref:putative quinol monooxygenase n=1 Tax=Zavarzinia sp. CC-PAN008 TaxID=3243332 RepID=UPI003F749B7C